MLSLQNKAIPAYKHDNYILCNIYFISICMNILYENYVCFYGRLTPRHVIVTVTEGGCVGLTSYNPFKSMQILRCSTILL